MAIFSLEFGTCVTGLLVFLLTFLALKLLRGRKGLPPGPRPLPIIGNLLYLAGADPLLNLRNLRDEYGDVYRLYFGQNLAIVFSGYEVIHDALVKKGGHFSNRPETLFSKKLLGKGIVFGKESVWKDNRKFGQNGLQAYGFSKTAMPLEERIMSEVRQLLLFLEKESGAFDLKEILSKSFANVIATVALGERCEYNDPGFNYLLYSIDQSAKLFMKSGILLDCFPFLQYLPGDLLQLEHIIGIQKIATAIYDKFIDKHKSTLEKGNVRDFIDLYLNDVYDESNEKCNQEQLRSIIGDIVGAGTETSATTIRWMILYLLNSPDIQHKLHQTIEDVIGQDREPTLGDRPQLPYVEATILETLRIATPAPLALPHTAKEDVIFRGHFIPQNTTIFVNIDATLNDPKVWKDPRIFRPERFLDSDGNLSIPKEFIVFSIGRRSCIGESLARMELFLCVTSLLQRFEFVSPADTQPPAPAGKLGLTHSPIPYLVRAVKRHSH